MKYTKGPWFIKGEYHDLAVYGKSPRGREVLVAYIGKAQPRHSRHNSAIPNGNLIAAAPDLLKSLDQLIGEIYESGCHYYMNESSNSSHIFNSRLEAAEKAVKKAKGIL